MSPADHLLFGRVLAPDDLGMNVVAISGDRIASIEPANEPPDGARAVPVIVPGFIDIQLNGAFGEDFSDPTADLGVVCRSLPQFGVTSFLPTVVSSPPDRYGPCLSNLSRAAHPGEARILGVHLEGPFINPSHAGTHDRDVLRPPDRDEALAWLDGDVRVITLAPELPGSLELIAELSSMGLVVAGGHSGATWTQAELAAHAGLRLGTHIFNAMRPVHHREPGIAGFLLASEIPVSVIADGRHLALETLKLLTAVKEGGLIAITDAVAGLGEPPGESFLGGRRVVSDGTVAMLPDGTLSGSVLPLSRMVANLIGVGMTPAAAVRAASAAPAELLGMSREIGEVRVGGRADLVVLDAEWRPLTTYVGGTIAWRDQARS